MAILSSPSNSSRNGKKGERKVTMEELRIKIDKNMDGLVDREELEAAIREAGGRMAWWKSLCAMLAADANGDGFLDESELKTLAKYADKHLNVKLSFVV